MLEHLTDGSIHLYKKYITAVTTITVEKDDNIKEALSVFIKSIFISIY